MRCFEISVMVLLELSLWQDAETLVNRELW